MLGSPGRSISGTHPAQTEEKSITYSQELSVRKGIPGKCLDPPMTPPIKKGPPMANHTGTIQMDHQLELNLYPVLGKLLCKGNL